jgi:hypothetical protein
MNRFKEPSTWAGLGALMPSLGELFINPKNPLAWVGVIGGLIAIIKREGAVR